MRATYSARARYNGPARNANAQLAPPSRRPNRSPAGDQSVASRLDRAASLFLETVVAHGQLTLTGRKFLVAAEGLDQRHVVERAAQHLCVKYPNATLDDVRDAVWGDAHHLFGWVDVAEIETSGSAKVLTLVPGATTVAGFTFDPSTTAVIWQSIKAEAARLVAAQGLRAFEMPRSAAIAHETGHAIVSMHDGVPLVSVDISRRVVEGRTAWGGFTKWAQPIPVDLVLADPATDPVRNILLRISSLIAGNVAEHILDPAGVREGSSLDEVCVSQVLAQALTHRPEFQDVQPKAIWDACWRRTAMIIHGNKKLAAAIIAPLCTTGIVKRKRLAKLTAKVRRLADDPLDNIVNLIVSKEAVS
jgi:hypothetical protein